jgi:hypothetical protein
MTKRQIFEELQRLQVKMYSVAVGDWLEGIKDEQT